MKILYRYILKNMLGPFFLGFSIVVIILCLSYFVTSVVTKFIGKGLEFSVIAEVFYLALPAWIMLAIPIGMLAGTVLAVSNMTASLETVAMLSSGISLRQFSIPVVIVGLIAFYLTERVANVMLPDANHKWKLLLYDVSRIKPTIGLKENEFTNLVEGYSILVRKINPDLGAMKGITIYDYSDKNSLSTIMADSAEIGFTYDVKYLVMKLYNGTAHTNYYESKESKKYEKMDFSQNRIIVKVEGFDLVRSDSGALGRGDRELSAAELLEIANNYLQQGKVEVVNNYKKLELDVLSKDSLSNSDNMVQQREYLMKKLVLDNQTNDEKTHLIKATIALSEKRKEETSSSYSSYSAQDLLSRGYLVEYHKKYAMSASALLFALLAVPIGMLSKRGGIGFAAGFSLFFYIIHWIGFIAGEKIADRGLLSPFLAMWFGNIVTIILILIFWLKNSNYWDRILEIKNYFSGR